jgi:hypothetical protein
MKIDYKTTKMTVYTPLSEDAGVYLADVDLKHNLIWVSLQHVDKIARFVQNRNVGRVSSG